MATICNLVVTKIVTAAKDAVPATDSTEEIPAIAEVLATNSRDLTGLLDVAKFQWVMKRGIAESGNEPILRGIKNFRAVFGAKMMTALSGADIKSAFITYEDDEVDPVVATPAQIHEVYNRTESNLVPFGVYHAAYTALMVGCPEFRVVKKVKGAGNSTSPAVTSALEDAALELLKI